MNKIKLIESIKAELSLPKTLKSTFKSYVWFQPMTGKFLYDDLFISSEIVIELIDEKTLKYNGVKEHQGEKMLQYILN